jgi:hypothetical protein
MSTNVEELINNFLTPPKGKSPEDIKARILHWVDIANHPENHVTDSTNQFAVAAKRRTARQNARSLIRKHPTIAAQIKTTDSQEGA